MDEFADALHTIFRTLGDPICYNGRTIYAEIHWSPEVERQAGIITTDAVIDVMKHDVPDPGPGDVVEIDGAPFHWGKIVTQTAEEWSIYVYEVP